MSRFLFKYIFIFLAGCCILSACSDELLFDGQGSNGEIKEFKGTLTLGLSTTEAAVRTRSVSCDPGASILLNNLWIGVFDINTGDCLGAKKYDEFNRTLLSGSVQKNILSVDFVALGEDIPLAYIVAVANYDGVTTHDNKNLEDLLPDFDNRQSVSWNDIVNLDIDTNSAYAGNKGENENSNAPFLVGFYQDATSLKQNPKIDQFSYLALGKYGIYPSAAAEGVDIKLGDSNDNTIFVASGAICLRRLVSHNIVKLNLTNGYEVTDVMYKRHNMPKAVYMLQRRTDTGRYSDFEEWQSHSPNFADHLLHEGKYDTSDAEFPYENDENWKHIEVFSWDDRQNVEFTFDHFENKHWGFGDLKSQSDREKLNADGSFAALCRGSEDAYNNFASYFVLKLHLINKSTGESADVEYTLHEGFCNNEDGKLAETYEEKCHDFGSFRNVNYTYNINIAGIDDITAIATSDDGDFENHPNGQSGYVWKMEFATGSQKKAVPIEGGIFDFNGRGIRLSNDPDLGFRIYGRDDKAQIFDICYNMPEGMYKGFEGVWPAGTPVIADKSESGILKSIIPESLLNEMLICNESGYFNIVDFITGVSNGTIPTNATFKIKFNRYDDKFVGMIGNFMRGLYIFDRNDIRNGMDADGCSGYNVAYGAIQYPRNPEIVKFDASNILWDNTFYQKSTTFKNVFVTKKQIFYGAENSVVFLRWKHDNAIKGYKINVYNDTYRHPAIIIPPTKTDNYLQTINGEEIFIYPLSTVSFPHTSSSASNYSFSVTPIVDEDVYEAQPVEIRHNANGDDSTCIRVCIPVWDISSTTDWKDLNLTGVSDAYVNYRGLVVYSTTEIKSNYGAKGSQICFGGSGSAGNRYFSFWASVPGKFAVTCKSNSSASDPTRSVKIARMDDNGSQVNNIGERYDVVYDSQDMSGSKTTYTSPVLSLNDNKPTEFRIYAGTIQFFKIEFIPSN